MVSRLDTLSDPLILTHAVAALVAVAGGAAVLAMRKGTAAHRLLGRLWVGTMLVTAVSSLFMRATILPVGRFGPIHLLSLITIAALVTAVVAIRRGDLPRHRKAMTRAFAGLVIAGVFALMPGRALNDAGHAALAWLQQLTAGLAEAAAAGAAVRAMPGRAGPPADQSA